MRPNGHDVLDAVVESCLPSCKGFVEFDVTVDAVAEADTAEGCELLVEVDAEFAEVLVVRVAECEDGILEISVTREVLEAEMLVEGLDRVGGFAFAVGAGDDDGVSLGCKGGTGQGSHELVCHAYSVTTALPWRAASVASNNSA